MPVLLSTPDVVPDIPAVTGGSFPYAAVTDARLQWKDGGRNPSLTYAAGAYRINEDSTCQVSPKSISESFPDVNAEMAKPLPESVAGQTPDTPADVRAAWDTVMKWLLLKSLMLRASRA